MATFTWTGDGGTDGWSDPTNWSPANGPPGASDLALFNTGIDSTITGNGTVGGLQFIGAEADNFTGTITAVGLAGQTATVSVDSNAEVTFAAGAALDLTGELAVGVTASGFGELSISGANMVSTSAVIGVASTSAGLLNVGGGDWQNNRSLVIGAAGDGVVSIGTGGVVVVGVAGRHGIRANVVLGQHAGSSGSLEVGGGELLASGNIVVGLRGTAQVDIGAYGSVDALHGTLSVGNGSQIALATGTVDAGDITIAAGGLIAGAGEIGATDNLVNSGEIRASGSLDLAGTISGGGTIDISTAATLLLAGNIGSQGALAFLGKDAILQLRQFPTVDAPITGFAPGDDILAADVTSVSFDAATGTLTLMTNDAPEGTLYFAGDLSGYTFHDHYGSNSVGTITVTARMP
jgi:fibronectin-binding autotransporter adhesin